MPDPAGQIVLVKACVETPPDNTHLRQGVWGYTAFRTSWRFREAWI